MMRSNAPENQPAFPAARVKKHSASKHWHDIVTSAAHSTAQHTRRCSRTCTLFTRPRVTRSITTSAQLHILSLYIMCISAGAVASRWHANATQRSMRRTRPHARYVTKMETSGGSAACPRCLQRGNRRTNNRASALMSSSWRMICARSCTGDSRLPAATRDIDTRVLMRRSVIERTLDESEEED